ncbi:MAG: glycosyltransferase [Actinomycetota bacterium]|nr:glycosyltransferase [Actinomycetota bacterium]
MRALVVTKFLPLPADAGGRQRSLAILRRIAERAEVTLCAYDDGRADKAGLEAMGVRVRSLPWKPAPRSVAAGLLHGRSVSAGRFWSPAMRRTVRQVAAEGPLDLLQTEYIQLAPLVDGVRADVRVLDLHNVESALARSYARSRGIVAGTPYRAEALALERLEKRALKRFDKVLVVSDVERDRLGRSGRDALVCPNGWEPTEPLPLPAAPVAVFVAVLGWPPNSDAARWLLDSVWPKVLGVLPDARLMLVGKNPPPDLAGRSLPGVEVVGAVPDVRPYLASARVALAPLLAGGGTRLKILEALDAGRPIVATTVAAEGLSDLVGSGVVLADEAESFASETVALLRPSDRSGDLAGDLGRAGNTAVRERHGWDRSLAPLVSVVEDLSGRRPSHPGPA